MLTDLLAALGLAIAIEGLLYAAFPDGMKRMMATMLQTPGAQLRIAGLIAALVGVGVVWLAKG